MDFIQNEILAETYKKEEQNDVDLNNKKIIKITRIDENFLSDLKKKRSLSTDSLESLTEETEKVKRLEPDPVLPNVEQFLNDTGLNVQLIAKNDKKLVKLNLNNKLHTTQMKTIISLDNNNKIINRSLMNMNDFDDLPSESDISNSALVIPITNAINQSKLIPLNKITPSTTVLISYKCVKCNKTFNDDSSLKLHQENNCSMNDSESELEKSFFDEKKEEKLDALSDTSLDSSAATVGKSKNKSAKKRIFICNECGMQYQSQSELSKHMLQTHENVKPYECSLCDMTFYELSSKNRHEKEHAGLKPFRCYICSFEFTRASNLRAHLLKVHPNEIGKLVNITKTVDNKLKFEFDLDAINVYREQNKLFKLSTNRSASLKESPSTLLSSNTSSTAQATSANNAVIYIKDPNNKNADIQHMVVYVDGKPIFVQNPKPTDTSAEQTEVSKTSGGVEVKTSQKSSSGRPKSNTSMPKSSSFPSTSNCKPVAKIPYLLAAAAAAAASNHRKNQQNPINSNTNNNNNNNSSTKLVSTDCARSSSYLITQSNTNKKDLKQDQEYIQLVSLLRQKNEKLFNPLLNKTY